MLQNARFRRFWAAQLISEAGSGVGAVAMPLTAVLTLGASAMDMGLLTAASTLPVPLMGLHAGVWVDRLPTRPILVAMNVCRGALLALVPLASVAGWLRIDVLWCVAFAVGVLAVVFDIAATSYVPALVERGQLVDANATIGERGRGSSGWPGRGRLAGTSRRRAVRGYRGCAVICRCSRVAGTAASRRRPRPARATWRLDRDP
jgi:MFS family permease